MDTSHGPRDLILKSQMTIREISKKSGVSTTNVQRCKVENVWPKNRRLKAGLISALLTTDPFPITINSVEEAQAVIDRLGAQREADAQMHEVQS